MGYFQPNISAVNRELRRELMSNVIHHVPRRRLHDLLSDSVVDVMFGAALVVLITAAAIAFVTILSLTL